MHFETPNPLTSNEVTFRLKSQQNGRSRDPNVTKKVLEISKFDFNAINLKGEDLPANHGIQYIDTSEQSFLGRSSIAT